MKRARTYIGFLSIPLVFMAFVGESYSAGGNPVRGAQLFENCAPCHTYNGNGVAGLPVDVLMQKMQAIQTGTFTNPKVQGMQKVLQPMSQQDLTDLAADITKM